MNYIKQNFSEGQVLKASHLNHIEEGLEQMGASLVEIKQSDWNQTDETQLDFIKNKPSIPDAIINPSTASVGQTLVVKSVDENGKPTEWETSSILSELEARGYIKVIQFLDGTSFGMPLQCNMTAEEIISNLTGNGVLAVYRRLYLNEHDPSDVYTSNVGPVTAADGGIRARKIDFNDGSAPIIVDASNNTITLDTNWTAPANSVKTINGAAPDENGDVQFIQPMSQSFMALSSGKIASLFTIPVKDVIDQIRTMSTYAPRVYRITSGVGDVRYATSFMFNADTYQMTLYYGDDVAPVILDGENETIFNDPNWTAPEEVALKSDVEVLQNSEANQQLVTDSEGNVKWEDRLCYEEEHDIVFIEETTVTGPYGQFFTTSEWPLKEGCSYEVTYNGEIYNCISFTFSGQPCLGNAKMANSSSPDTGEPFIITGIAPKMYSYVMFKNNTTHTFSVRGPANVITKIPSKYLSASITAGTGLNANAMNGLPAENASGDRSHAEGHGTAIGALSHAEGTGTAKGAYSHAEGFGTITSSNFQHAQGQYNVEDAENKYAHIVGNGTYDARSNAHTIDWNGVGWFAGGLKVGGTGQDDAAAVEVATKPYVDEAISNNIKQADWNQTDESAKDFILNKPVPMTDEEIDAICGGTLTLDITENALVDITTGIVYRIYVEDGKLSMHEVNESTNTSHLVFVDISTDSVYKVYVEDGKLHMMEAE